MKASEKARGLPCERWRIAESLGSPKPSLTQRGAASVFHPKAPSSRGARPLDAQTPRALKPARAMRRALRVPFGPRVTRALCARRAARSLWRNPLLDFRVLCTPARPICENPAESHKSFIGPRALRAARYAPCARRMHMPTHIMKAGTRQLVQRAA